MDKTTLIPLDLQLETKLGLSSSIDESLLKTRDMGKESLTYVSQNTVVDLLNKNFNYMWSFVIDEQWKEDGETMIKKENPKWPFTEKNTNMDLVKIDPEGKRYIELEQGAIAWTRGRIRVPFLLPDGEVLWIEKSACGAQAIIGNQAVQSTNAYKGSMSDCLKKCASLWGIALELYRDETEEEYFQNMRDKLTNYIWTEEVIERNRENYNLLLDKLEEFGWSFDDLSYYVKLITDGLYVSFEKMPEKYLADLLEIISEDEEELID